MSPSIAVPPGRTAAALLLAALLVSPLAAQTTCIPFAGGVPAAPGPPVWWAGPTPAVFAEKVSDPRWRGAVAHTFVPGGAGERSASARSRATAAERRCTCRGR
jgi:hypothetical protein